MGTVRHGNLGYVQQGPDGDGDNPLLQLHTAVLLATRSQRKAIAWRQQAQAKLS